MTKRYCSAFAPLLSALVLLPPDARSQGLPEPPPQLSPRQLASQIPGRDLSLNPPAVTSAQVQFLKQPNTFGNARMFIRFDRNEKQLPAKLVIALERTQTYLRDDGLGADMRALDGVYTAYVLADTDLMTRRRRSAEAAQLLSGDFFNRAPLFNGHERTGFAAKFVGDPARISFEKTIPGDILGIPELVNAPSKLLITGTSVIEDATRTFKPCPAPAGNPDGKWAFKYLMTQMANTPVTGIGASAFVRNWLTAMETSTDVKNLLVDPWVAASGGPALPLNLDIAPFRLRAIVNRVDLRKSGVYGGGSAGELRFVFQAFRPGSCESLEFYAILEYGVPRTGCFNIRSWGQLWYDLPTIGAPGYNAALEAITEQVVTAVANPAKLPNRSALNQLRVNERINEFSDTDWVLREFRIASSGGSSGSLVQVETTQTPAGSYRASTTLRDYINSNEAQILAGKHVVPPAMLATASVNIAPHLLPPPSPFWNPAGVLNNNARAKFAVNTCNGCHSSQETKTTFVMVGFAGGPLSPFLTGTTVTDAADGVTLRHFNDLQRRAADLEALVNSSCALLVAEVPKLLSN